MPGRPGAPFEIRHMILVDTDISLGTPGAEIDDGAALMVLLRTRRDQVCAITTVHGNVPVGLATQNAARMQAYLSARSVPLGRGASLPLVEDPSWFSDFQAGYGPTPAWPVPEEAPWAVDLILDQIRSRPGELTILALGPLTNLALAVRLAPEIAGQVKEVIAMGGSFREDADPEFNIRCDPEAAQFVFDAGWPLRLIGLEITRQVLFTRQDFHLMSAEHPVNDLLINQSLAWIDRVEENGWESGGCALHDAVAVAALLDESLFRFVPASVEVELQDNGRRGQTRVVPLANGNSAIRVATSLDAGRCRELIWDKLNMLPWSTE